MSTVPYIVEQYVKLISKGLKKLEDVPEELRADVEKILRENN